MNRVFFAIIVDVHGTSPGDPNQISYDFEVIDPTARFGVIRNIKPTRRISDGAQVIAAEVNDIGIVRFDDDTPYLFIAEGIHFQECGNSPSVFPLGVR